MRVNEDLAGSFGYGNCGLYASWKAVLIAWRFVIAYTLKTMASAAGLVLAAGGIAAANEAIFVPVSEHKDFASSIKGDTNLWRIVPATAILALMLTGLEKVSEPLGKGLAALVVLAVLVIPFGNAPSPLENAGNALKAVKL